MRNILWLSLLIVAKANCDSLSGGSVQSGELPQEGANPAEYSRVNHEVYKVFASPVKTAHITPPPIPKLPPLPTRSTPSKNAKTEVYSKPTTMKSTHGNSQNTKKPDEDDVSRLPYRIQAYSVTDDSSNEDADSCTNEYNDAVLVEPVEYPNRVPPTTTTYAVPSAEYNQRPPSSAQQQPVFVRRPAIFAPQPPGYRTLVRAVRRGFRSPVYRRPVYDEILNAPSPVYRPVEYTPPVAYAIPVPTVRRIAYAAAPVRYIQRPSVAYESVGGIDYDNVINVDYEEVKK